MEAQINLSKFAKIQDSETYLKVLRFKKVWNSENNLTHFDHSPRFRVILLFFLK